MSDDIGQSKIEIKPKSKWRIGEPLDKKTRIVAAIVIAVVAIGIGIVVAQLTGKPDTSATDRFAAEPSPDLVGPGFEVGDWFIPHSQIAVDHVGDKDEYTAYVYNRSETPASVDLEIKVVGIDAKESMITGSTGEVPSGSGVEVQFTATDIIDGAIGSITAVD